MKWRVRITAVAALSLTLIGGCHRANKSSALAEAGAIPAKVVTVERRKVPVTEEVIGTVRAKLHASIEAKISARIESVAVSPGRKVKKGERLIELDPREIQARLDQATVQRTQYARDADRLRKLLNDSAISPQEFEAAESRHRVALATVIELETLLGYTKITAPFDGVVTRKLADVGDLAAPGKPLLEIDDPSLLRLEADVPESLIGSIEVGVQLPVRIAELKSELQGTVAEIAPSADPASRTFQVKIDLPAMAGVRAGMFGRAAIPVGEAMILRVPAEAVVRRGQMELVFVEQDHRAQMRIVKTGKRAGNEIELVSGVSPGERVVVEAAAGLRDGQALEPRP